MFAIERLNKIKDILLKEKRVDVFELSRLFSVSEVTIRRDLDKLEKKGFLVKIYGGAVLNEEMLEKAPASEATVEQSEENKLIGKIAAHLIENGDAVYLSPWESSREIVRHLKEKRVTIVTNDFSIGQLLKERAELKVILTGGDLIPSTTTLVGRFALQTLNDINIDKAFIEVKGVHLDAGFTVDSHEEVTVIEAVRKISNDVIMMADYTKFNQTGFAKLGDLQIADQMITNKQIPADYKKYFFEHAIKLYTTFEFE